MVATTSIKAINFGEKWLDLSLPFPCELHHCRARGKPSRRRFSALIHYMEPRQFKWPVDEVRKNAHLFDVILTSEPTLLDLPNVRFCLFGGRWVKETPANKDFDLSFLYSRGAARQDETMAGYRDRRTIWSRRSEITLPKRFYTSVKRPPGSIDDVVPYPFGEKDPLFTSMFSVVVENDYQENYFTEKLIDALSTMTVPIYFGCPNIGQFFNTDGMIIPNSIDEMIGIVNRLTPEDYASRVTAMKENFEASKPYWDHIANLRDHLLAAHEAHLERAPPRLPSVMTNVWKLWRWAR